jgi:hypothetical protein
MKKTKAILLTAVILKFMFFLLSETSSIKSDVVIKLLLIHNRLETNETD